MLNILDVWKNMVYGEIMIIIYLKNINKHLYISLRNQHYMSS